MKKSLVVVMLSAGTVLLSQEPPKDWIDPQTGHRIVRLTGDAGGSTLYFHDNAFSPDGEKMMINTPSGIAVVDVAKIGTAGLEPEIVGPAVRGGYFARHSREIYYGSAGGAVKALNVDTKQTRDVPHSRGLINADETLSVVKNGKAVDVEGKYPRPPVRPIVPQLHRMFPGKRMEDLTPDQQYSVKKEDGLAPRALNPSLQSFVFTSLETGESRETGFQYGDLNHLQFNPAEPNRDNTLFASDGGDSSQVAYSTDGTWINLFRVQPNETVTREKLADMSKHNYVTGRGGVEPNVHITPDKKWVVFTGQFSPGQRHVYAVEIERAAAR